MKPTTPYVHKNPHQRRELVAGLLDRNAQGVTVVKVAFSLDWNNECARKTLEELVEAGRALRASAPGGGKVREALYFARRRAVQATPPAATAATRVKPVWKPLNPAYITPLIRAGAGEAEPGIKINASIYDRQR